MFCYYLQHRSYYYASDKEVISHVQEINTIITSRDKYDHFIVSDDFDNAKFDRSTTIGDFFGSSRIPNAIRIRLWPSIKKHCKIVKKDYSSPNEMNSDYSKTSNAFLGPRFYHRTLNLIVCRKHYSQFRKEKALVMVNGTRFGNCCEIVLKNVVVTPDGLNKVKPLGHMVQPIFTQILELDEYIKKYWNQGSFSITDVRANTSLDISDESNSVKQNPHLKHYRYFNIPGFGGQYCYPHIKIGDLRIHLFVDEASKKIHIPYFGPHLPL